jgi:hypothetical protein
VNHEPIVLGVRRTEPSGMMMNQLPFDQKSGAGFTVLNLVHQVHFCKIRRFQSKMRSGWTISHTASTSSLKRNERIHSPHSPPMTPCRALSSIEKLALRLLADSADYRWPQEKARNQTLFLQRMRYSISFPCLLHFVTDLSPLNTTLSRPRTAQIAVSKNRCPI